MGAVIAADRVFEAFADTGYPFLHGMTFGGHPVSAAVALANINVLESEGIVDNVVANEAGFRSMLESLVDLPIVGNIRGAGYFFGVELVRDATTKQGFDRKEIAQLHDVLSRDLLKRGLLCRVDDRGAPVVQFAPPLIAGPEQFAEIEAILRPALDAAAELMGVG